MKKFERFLAVLLAAIMVLSLCSGLTVLADDDTETSGTCGDNLTWEFDEDTGTLTISGSGEMEDYDSGAFVNDTPAPWYDFRSSITSVNIENDVASIGNNAFYKCTGLANVMISDSVTSIGNYTFYSCSSLTSIIIPDGVTSIGSYVFFGCKSLTSIEIPGSVTYITQNAFRGCSSLTSITIPDSVTAIGMYAFEGCSSLTSIAIPDSVTSIESYTFSGCSSLTSITIPDSVTSIESYTFSGCSSLTSITIPDSIKSIRDYAFKDCSSLTSITIPDSVTSIGSRAFYRCGNLISIEIPDSVTSIGKYAFSNCTSLADIAIPDSVTSINEGAFYNCSGLTSITIPDSITSIGNYAFSGCSSLVSIVIPDSVTTIKQWAFSDCISLSDVYYSGSEEDWSEISIGDSNDCLTSATIHYNSTGPESDETNDEESTDTETGTDSESDTGTDYLISTDASDFNLTVYRSQYLLDNSWDTLYIDTPCELLAASANENGLNISSAIWDTFSLVSDSLDDITSIYDEAVEAEDIYMAILLNTLEASSSADIIPSELEDIIKNIKSMITQTSSELELDEYLDYTLATTKDLSELSSEECEDLSNKFAELFKEEYPALSGITDAAKVISKILDTVSDVEDFIEYISACALLADTNEYMQDVLLEMYSNSAGNAYLQVAIAECMDIMDSSMEELFEQIVLGGLTMLGTDAAEYLVNEIFWDTVSTVLQTKCPIVAVLQSAYKAGSLISNLLVSTDDITEQYAKMVALLDIEESVDAAYETLRSAAAADPDDEDAAGAYLAAFDLIFSIRDQDVEEAYNFVDVLDTTLLNSILTAISGESDYSSYKETLASWQKDYYLVYENGITYWVIYLENDYPGSGLYEQYSSLLDESMNRILTKEYLSACPVDVYVYDSDGNLVAYYADGRLHRSEDAEITILVEGDEKTVRFYNDADYTIKYVGTDSGTMDITVTEYDEEGETVRTVNFYDVALEEGTTYETAVDSTVLSEESYILTDTDSEETVESNCDSLLSDDTAYSLSIVNGIGTYGSETFVSAQLQEGVTVEILAAVPNGYEFCGWEVTEGSAVISDQTSPSTTIVTGDCDTIITAVLTEAESEESDTHTHSYEAVVTEPTCTEQGYTTYTCTVCGDSYISDYTDATGHTAGEAVVENSIAATCTEAGSYDSVVYCTVCGEEISRETVTVAATGHSYLGTNVCTVCGTLKSSKVSDAEITLSKTSYTYSGSAKKPSVTVVINGTTLTKNTDYTVSYSNNTNAGTATVTIKGKGSYSGTKTAKFTIKAKSINSATVTLSSTSYTYNGKVKKPSVKSVVLSGTTLSSSDYTVKYASGRKNVGTYMVRITGTGNYMGTTTTTFTIKAKSISSATVTLSSTSYTYNGKVKKPSVKSVKVSDTTLSSSDYTVKYASGRKSIGTYNVKVTGTGNYTGTATVTFTIKPGTVKISSAASSAAKKLTVKWSKVSGSVTGYQVRYKKSTSSSWTTVTVKASTLSKTISSLTAGKKYNVQVRAYKTVSGKKYYGSWSSTKSVTVKKAQTLTVKLSSSKTVSYSKVKKAKQTVTAITKVSGAKGTVTYSKSSGKSYFTVNSKTGKITVKKGTPKGTYTLKIKVTSAAKGTYAAATKTVTVKIKVK